MKKATYLAIACFILVVAGGIYYFVKDEPLPPPPEPPKQAAQSDPASFLTFAGSSIVQEEDGKKVYELGAESIEVDPKTKKVYFKNLKGSFYQPKGGKIELVASLATLDSNTRDIFMEGSIKAVNEEGVTFMAEKARYDGKDRRLFGSGGVKVIRDDTVISGDNLESDANMVKYRVTGNARVTKGGNKQ